MDIEILNKTVKMMRGESFKNSDQVTLGRLITMLENLNTGDRENPEIVYDFGYLFPTDIDSWRGSYDELALDYTDDKKGERMQSSKFLKMLKDTIGKTLEGYKGGLFKMHEDTPIWVSNYGEACNTAITGVLYNGYQIVLQTKYCEF